jgi:hypothetical protein
MLFFVVFSFFPKNLSHGNSSLKYQLAEDKAVIYESIYCVLGFLICCRVSQDLELYT